MSWTAVQGAPPRASETTVLSAGDVAAGRSRHPALRAEVGQAAACAAGPTGEADGAAVIDELMAEDDPLAPRDDRDEVALGTDRVGAAREVEAPANPADVGVDNHARR